MALAKIGGSCSIFVGNVPYDANEDDLKEIFNRAGQVNSVRVVCDKDTKQPKGYAFIDFADHLAKEAAIEKLNNYEYNGRKLRVDGAERELNNSRGGPFGGGPPPPAGRGGPVSNEPLPIPTPQQTVADRVAEMREKEALEQAKVAAAEMAERAEVARLMETLSPMQLLHLLGEIQRLAVGAPEVARALVGENIQLALALQHAQFLVGLLEEPSLHTDAEVKERAKSVREKLWQSGAPVLPPPPSAGLAHVVPPQLLGLAAVSGAAPRPFAPTPAFGHALGAATALGAAASVLGAQPCLAANPLLAASASTVPRPTGITLQRPPVAQTVVRPGVAPGLVAGGGTVGPAGDQQRRDLLERLVQLSPEQIDQLPHDQKVQLLEFLQTLPPA